jgi:hypothetical protein
MEDSDRVMVKAAAFGAVLVVLAAVFRIWLPEVFAWGLSSFVGILLFHWSPPRIHRNMTVVKSVVLSLAGAITAAAAVVVVNTVFD